MPLRAEVRSKAQKRYEVARRGRFLRSVGPFFVPQDKRAPCAMSWWHQPLLSMAQIPHFVNDRIRQSSR
jgi:hypothetical protein